MSVFLNFELPFFNWSQLTPNIFSSTDHSPAPMMMSGEPNVGVFIDDHKRRADTDLNAPPYDDLRNYAYEGGGSTAGSLSSLASG